MYPAVSDLMLAGYPAWAGIDLLDKASMFYHCGLPRVGGDRPILAVEGDRLQVVTPRGRG